MWRVFGEVCTKGFGMFLVGFLVRLLGSCLERVFWLRFLKTVFGMFLGSVIAEVTGVMSLEMGFW